MATKTTKTSRGQQSFDGLEPEENKVIRKAAEHYEKCKEDHKLATEDLTDAKRKLIEVMHEQERDVIQLSDMRIEIVPGEESVKVKRAKQSEENGDA